MRQRRLLELMTDYDLNLQLSQGKVIPIIVDTLSRKPIAMFLT